MDTPEIVPLAIDFASLIPSGDSLASCSGAVTTYTGTDAGAANLALGVATATGTVVTQWVGGAFVIGVIYRWWANISTTLGSVQQIYGHVACVAGSSPSPITPPPNPVTTTSITASYTITTPGVYEVHTAGVTIGYSNPNAWLVKGQVLIKDMTGSQTPNITLTGSYDGVTGYSMTNPGQAVTLSWSATSATMLVS